MRVRNPTATQARPQSAAQRPGKHTFAALSYSHWIRQLIMSDGTAPVSDDAVCGFVCVCVQKSIEFDIKDHKLHRATKDRELHEELEKLSSISPSQYAYQLGGGCRVMGASTPQHPLHIASCGESVAAFEGTLSNLDELAKAFPMTYTVTAVAASPGSPATGPSSDPPSPDTPGTPQPSEASAAPANPSCEGSEPPNPAQLVCLMYDVMGQDLLGLLKGKFSFCLYHGKTGRVLAARDSSGSVSLLQGMSDAQSLVISTRRTFLDSCQEVKEFEPGYFKYGWYAEPRKFGPSATHHHHGHQPHSHAQRSRGGSTRTSLDHSTPHAKGQGSGRSARPSLDHGQGGQGTGRSARPSLDHGSGHGGGRTGRASLDHGHGGQQQQQQGGGRAARNSSDSGAHRRGGADVGAGAAKGALATDTIEEANNEGWSIVQGRGRKSIDAGAPSSARQGRRSMDTRPSHITAAKPAADKAPKTPPPKTASKGTVAAQASAAPMAGFKWDVNAPEFKPVAC